MDEIREAAELAVVAAQDLMHTQYNVFTAENTCRGVLQGLNVEVPVVLTRRSHKRSKAERIGYDLGCSIRGASDLMDERIGQQYMDAVVHLLEPVVGERIRLAEEVRVKKGRGKAKVPESGLGCGRGIVTFLDVFLFVLASNIRDGKVWASYSDMEYFFADLVRDGLEGVSKDVRECILRTITRAEFEDRYNASLVPADVFWAYDDDYFYMQEGRPAKTMQVHTKGVSAENLSSMVEIARRYGLYLESIGR